MDIRRPYSRYNPIAKPKLIDTDYLPHPDMAQPIAQGRTFTILMAKDPAYRGEGERLQSTSPSPSGKASRRDGRMMATTSNGALS